MQNKIIIYIIHQKINFMIWKGANSKIVPKHADFIVMKLNRLLDSIWQEHTIWVFLL